MRAIDAVAPDVDVLIVGGGIAGWSAAWFASRAGREVVVVDEGLHRASDLPLALINPLRGHRGRLVVGGVDGMRATFAMIDALCEAGHRVVAGRGLYRPLIDLPETSMTEAFWTERIGEHLAFDWHASVPSLLRLATSVPALYLLDAGWVEPAGLLTALRVDSGATLLGGRVTTIAADQRGDVGRGGTVLLADGSKLRARSLLWCGGAWGAALIDRDPRRLDHAPGPDRCDREQDGAPSLKRQEQSDALYKPGSLVCVDGPLTEVPMSFGLYVAPMPAHAPQAMRTLIGPTREDSCTAFPEGPAATEALRRLEVRIAQVFGKILPANEVWRGVRLARLSTASQRALHGIPTSTALGSRGFLMAPLLASRWAASL